MLISLSYIRRFNATQGKELFIEDKEDADSIRFKKSLTLSLVQT